MIERLAIAGNGGSFANKYARKYATDILVKQIFSMTVEDAENILAEVRANNAPLSWPGLDEYRKSVGELS